MQRPTGITILAIVDFLTGAISLVFSCFALAVSGRIRAGDEDTDEPSVLTQDVASRGNLVFWIGLIGAGVSLFKLFAAVGLWTLKPWGRQLALVSGTLYLLAHVSGVIRGAITPSGVIGLLVNGAVLLYLSRPEVRRALADVPIDVLNFETYAHAHRASN
jgi:uncharacterized membrane protein (DUF2068 family)